MESSQGLADTGAHSLGKYRLIAEIGHGGMADVYLAVVRGPGGFNKLLVIKEIRRQLARDPEFLGMFLDEARLAARLSHANVVQTNEVGQDGERYFIAMEYLDGQPLNRVLHRVGRGGVGGAPGISLAMHLKILSETLSGLHHAHELTDYDGTPLGVVHRDVTPHNVFITYDGGVKVVDFGIAKALNSSSETQTGVLKGKVPYMAPEQAQGERVDRRADLFSIGVMLWEAAVGKRLWRNMPDITILQRLLAGDIPRPRLQNPEIPERLEAIILKALAHEREDRYATAVDLQADLDAFIDSTGERVTARDIGKLISAAFEADRAKIKAIIDEQLRKKAGVIEIPTLPMRETAQSLPQLDPNSQPSTGGSASDPSYPAASMLLANASAPEDDGRAKRRNRIAALAIGIGVVFGVGAWGIARTLTPPRAAIAVTTEAVAPAPVPVAEVEINIAATPAEARIFLDDKPVSNPYKTKLPSDKAKHQLRVEANGFLPVTRPVSLETAVDIDLALQKDTSPASKGDKASAPVSPVSPAIEAQPPAPSDDGMKRPGARPKRTLDTTNPYPQ